ncbi:MAG: MBL fold metallo-hydrolase [Candidatus Brocadiia bacterium]
MRIEMLATESLGVRGLCCVVEVAGRSILIDPGMAMGYMRHGLMPHPVQVAAGERIREAITAAAREATDMVISHFHGDHMPLVDANPYQLSAERVRESLRSVRLWTKGLEDQSDRMRQRAESFAALLDRPLRPAEGRSEGCLAFSHPVSHGEEGNGLGTLMMTRVAGDGEVFVHASDVQLLDRRAVARILRWKPTVVLLSGPPLYLELSSGQGDLARELALELGRHVETLIMDHHLLRCPEGLRWIDDVAGQSPNRVMCAADFMGRPRRLLEAERERLYDRQPVPEDWHERYRRGLADTGAFQYEQN